MKVRQDNDVTDCIGIVYAKNDIELYKPIISGAVCDGTRQDNDVTDLISMVYAGKEIELSLSIKVGLICDKN